MNKVFLIGNVTKDPDLKQTNSGTNVCKFGLAVQRKFATSGQEKETDFFNIIAWRQLGELCEKYLKKGAKTAVFGTIQFRQYEDKDGVKRTATDVIADEVEFLSPKSEEGTKESKKPSASDKLEPVDDSDDLPF